MISSSESRAADNVVPLAAIGSSMKTSGGLTIGDLAMATETKGRDDPVLGEDWAVAAAAPDLGQLSSLRQRTPGQAALHPPLPRYRLHARSGPRTPKPVLAGGSGVLPRGPNLRAASRRRRAKDQRSEPPCRRAPSDQQSLSARWPHRRLPDYRSALALALGRSAASMAGRPRRAQIDRTGVTLGVGMTGPVSKGA